MRKIAILGIAALLAAPAAAQTSRIEGGSTALSNFVFFWETRLEPPMPALGEGFSMLVLTTPPSTIHRVMLDRAQKVYFGYDARVEVVGGRVTLGAPDQRVYQVTFGPLSMTTELEKALGGNVRSWKLLPTPRFPDTQTRIAGSEVIEVVLLTNDTWGQKMTEYITIQESQPLRLQLEIGRRDFVFAPGAPRDFTAADVELRLEAPVVRAPYQPDRKIPQTDGHVYLFTGGFNHYRVTGEARGSIVWIYVPGRGRFALSLVPRGQFRRAGSVRGTSLTFTVDGLTYTVSSASQIAPGQSAFNLYVLHQPRWKPTFENANLDTVHIGAADRLEYLTPSR